MSFFATLNINRRIEENINLIILINKLISILCDNFCLKYFFVFFYIFLYIQTFWFKSNTLIEKRNSHTKYSRLYFDGPLKFIHLQYRSWDQIWYAWHISVRLRKSYIFPDSKNLLFYYPFIRKRNLWVSRYLKLFRSFWT